MKQLRLIRAGQARRPGGYLPPAGPAALLATALVLALAGGPGVSAQPQQPRLECNKSVDWQITWTATNVPPVGQTFPFEAEAGQVARLQFTVRGPLWYNDVLTAQLAAPSGIVLYPNFNGEYVLPVTGTYRVLVYGMLASDFDTRLNVAQNTTMPYTIALRCSPPPATPTPPPAPEPTPTPSG